MSTVIHSPVLSCLLKLHAVLPPALKEHNVDPTYLSIFTKQKYKIVINSEADNHLDMCVHLSKNVFPTLSGQNVTFEFFYLKNIELRRRGMQE